DGGEPGVGDQIVFTRFQAVGGPAPSGHYRGLRFGANLIAAATLLRNVVVEFGGRRNTSIDQGAVEAVSGSAPEVRDTIIRESLNYGLFAHSGAGSDTTDWFSGNQLTANGRAPINIGSDDVSTLGSNLALTGNGEDRIFVRGSTVSRATADWANHGVPFYLGIEQHRACHARRLGNARSTDQDGVGQRYVGRRAARKSHSGRDCPAKRSYGGARRGGEWRPSHRQSR
ncbi:MAG: hypothetical protein JRF54_00640, partial [Deltaproteobacteria bacterium]|nr:hypothetical protein [Deltaproteobacteria bacterium]